MNLETACEKLTTELLVEIQDIESPDLRHDLTQRKIMMAISIGFNEGRKKLMTHNRRKVIQLNLIGQPIKLHETIREASKETGIDNSSIGKAARGYRNHKTAGGFKWKFTDK